MKVILKADIKGVGKKDEVINASDGYVRNFLFPKNLAVEANAENMAKLQAQNSSKQFKKDTEKEEAQKLSEKMNKISLRIQVKAGENGKIFGGVSAKDISEAFEKQHNIKIDKKKVDLKETIKTLGERFDKNDKANEILKELEDKGKDVTIITQNIDGLHSKAGSSKVLELHGTIMNNYCTKCHKYYDANYVFNNSGIPRCTCGGTIKPDVVLYNEPLPEDVWEEAIKVVAKSDLMIVLGTSLRVYPAAYLVDYFHGNLVLINRSSIGHEDKAKLIINDKLSNVFSKI